jgi:hypothetical protein
MPSRPSLQAALNVALGVLDVLNTATGSPENSAQHSLAFRKRFASKILTVERRSLEQTAALAKGSANDK